MAIQRKHVAAGSQFNDVFDFQSGSDVEVKRVSLQMGSESKNVTVTIVDKYGAQFAKLYEKLAMTNLTVDLIGSIPLGPDEKIKVVTTGATSEMFATVIF